MLMWFPSNKLYKSVCWILPHPTLSSIMHSITICPNYCFSSASSNHYFVPREIGRTQKKKSSVMTVFSFKFSLAVSLETLNNNNKERRKRKAATLPLPKCLRNLWNLFYMQAFACERSKSISNAFYHLLCSASSNRWDLLCTRIYSYWFSDAPLNTGNIKRLITCIRKGRCIFCCSF